VALRGMKVVLEYKTTSFQGEDYGKNVVKEFIQ
jgi:hypothetical protein